MPYHDYRTTYSHSGFIWKVDKTNDDTEVWPDVPLFGSGISSWPTTTGTTYRYGSNSTLQELNELYAPAAFDITRRRRTIGYIKTRQPYTVWFSYRGRVRAKTKYKTVRRPIQVTEPVIRLKNGDLDKYRRRNVYLKPNDLRFGLHKHFMQPSSFVVGYKNSGLTGWDQYKNTSSGLIKVYGPGYFQPDVPNFYQMAVNLTLGPLSLGGGVNPDLALSNEALFALYTKVQGSIPDYMTAAAESPKALAQLKNILKEGLEFGIALKKLDLKRLAGKIDVPAKEFYSAWLGWIYGASPVIQDISDSIDLVKNSDRLWRSYSVSRVRDLDPDVTVGYDVFHGEYTDKSRRIERWGVILEGKLTIDRLVKHTIRPSSFVSTAYQLIPFSFVLDWAVPIGDYLASASVFEKQSHFAWQTSAVDFERVFAGNLGQSTIDPSIVYSSPGFILGQRLFEIQRRAVGTIPDMPDIKVSKPVVDMHSIGNLFNLFSILVSQTDGLKSPIRR